MDTQIRTARTGSKSFDGSFSCLVASALLLLLLLVVFGGEVVGAGFPVQARFAMQEAVLLDRASGALGSFLAILDIAVVRIGRRGDVGDLLWHRMLATDVRYADV
jgi:hypothetical protein